MDFLYIILIELIALTLVALAVTMEGKKFLRLNEVPSRIQVDNLLPKLARRAISWFYLPVFLIILLWFSPVPGLIAQGFYAVFSFLDEKGVFWPVLLLSVLLSILLWQVKGKEKINAVSKKAVSFLEKRWLKEESVKYVSFLEKVWLKGLPEQEKQLYDWHIRWRFSWWRLRMARTWRSHAVGKWLMMQRWLWMLLTGLGIICLLLWQRQAIIGLFPSCTSSKGTEEVTLGNILLKNSGVWTFLAALIGAPIAYLVWVFRNQNNLWQIENNRKDINLKDFQKLSEWASGLHLPEKKVTISENNSGKSQDSDVIDIPQIVPDIPQTRTAETYSPMDGVLYGHPSRRDGAASLQIAAIYQLNAFLRGDYGKFFRRPAFQLLKSLWLSLMQPHVEAWKNVEQELQKVLENPADKEQWDAWREGHLAEWRNKLQKTIGSPLGIALTTVLAAEAGKNFREHKEDLPNGCFAGLNHQLPSPKSLELDGLKLKGINFQGAVLTGAKLQGASLREANLQGAVLTGAKLQGASLREANLQGASLREANLQGAVLRLANLQGADLIRANLQGADLIRANLQGAILRNIKIDNKTILIGATADDKTVIEVSEIKDGKFVPDETKSKDLRDQLIAKGLTFVDNRK